MLSSELKSFSLSDLCEIRYGKDHKKLSNGVIPVYGTGGIMRYVDSYLYDKESVLIPRKGTLSNIYFTNEKFWTVDTLFWTKINEKIVFPKFLYYKLLTINFSEMNVGSAVPSLTTELLNRIIVDIPNLTYQKEIANILSSLDNKIELNNKINKNLEELAQTLYKRWFVDFEFPNENGEPYKSSGGEMIESELGSIPLGWRVEPLGDSSITKLISSGINQFTGIKKYIATADVSDSTITSFETNITYVNRPSRANMQPIKNSLWFAKMKDSRKLIRVSRKSNYLIQRCIFSTGFAGIESSEAINYIWTLLTTTEFDHSKNNLCNGTTMQAINNENIKRIKIVIPEKDMLRKFEDYSDSIFEKIHNNEIEISKLSKTRDELLPKLMNGEIEVPIEE